MERHTMLGLSTAHLKESTLAAMELHTDPDAIGDSVMPALFRKHSGSDIYGYFVPLFHDEAEQDFAEGTPADFIEVYRFAVANGFTWIMFDWDCDVVADLPTYTGEERDIPAQTGRLSPAAPDPSNAVLIGQGFAAGLTS